MRSPKGFSMAINLLLGMTVLLVLAAVIALITGEYVQQFRLFGVNQTSTNLNPFG